MTPTIPVGNSIVLQTIPPFLQDTIASIIAYIPVVISAIIILIIGWIVGRILAAIVKRVLGGIGISDYTQGTPLESDEDSGGIAGALGKLVAYIVYFYALLAAADVLGIGILSQLLRQIGAFLPVILSAVVVLVIGFVIGRIVGEIVADIIGGFGLNSFVRGTPLGDPVESAGGVGNVVGKIVEYYIYFFALLTAADILQIPALTQVLNTFASYIPTLIGALVVLVIGIYVADLVGDIIADTGSGRATDFAAIGVMLFIYYITITIALDTMGFSTNVLTTLFSAVVTALSAILVVLALGVALAIGLGGQDFVANNIDDWFGQAKSSASDMAEEDDDDDGGDDGDDGDDSDYSSDFESAGSSDDSGPGGPSGTGGSDD